MRIHPSDPAAIARKVNLAAKAGKRKPPAKAGKHVTDKATRDRAMWLAELNPVAEINALAHERAIKRQSLIEERKTMGHIMDEFVEE
jgi:hypothetical protein